MTDSILLDKGLILKPWLKYVLLVIFACIIICLLIIQPFSNKNHLSTISHEPAAEDSMIEFTISAVGDLMCHSTQFNYAKVNTDSFNFVPCFEYIESHLQSADFLIGNLETTLRGPELPYSGYPFFNTPDDYAESLKKIGFDFIVTANNHSNDTGEKGILRTIKILDELGLAHTGSYQSQNDRDSIRHIIIQGVQIAIVAYTYSTNGIDLSEGKPWLVNFCDSVLIRKDIVQSRADGAELVIVFYHFGEEYQRLPSLYQKQFVNYAVDCGADLIIGSHPHVIQPVDFFIAKQAGLDTGFVAYSLGNFISNQNDQYTTEGILLNIHITKNKNSKRIRISEVNYVPTWVYKGKHESKKLHVVMPAFMAIDTVATKLPGFITPVYFQDMKTAIKNTADILSTYTDRVKPVEVQSF